MELLQARKHLLVGQKIQSLRGVLTLDNSVRRLDFAPSGLMTEAGYDKNAQPVQVLPRPVTKFKFPVIELALSVRCIVHFCMALIIPFSKARIMLLWHCSSLGR